MKLGGILPLLAFGLWLVSCSASGDEQEFSADPVVRPSDGEISSSSKIDVDDTSSSEDVAAMFHWAEIPKTKIGKGAATYTVDAFSMLTTEVTQKEFSAVMHKLPGQPKESENSPVVNVSWYDAVLFCNALSLGMGLDTVYTYGSVGEKNYLKNLSIRYDVRGVRLPTEMEWEVAARGNTVDRYYWGEEKASDYAYYGQSNGPSEVALLIPNAYSLYDMAGNAAEWVNDWYHSYEANDVENPTGPESGSLRCVRGGSWADVLKDSDGEYHLSSANRDKRDPLLQSAMIGFRVVLSDGF